MKCMMNNTKTKTIRCKSTGFTLVELLVTIAVVTLMMFLVNRLFTDTANVVSRGAQTSDILAKSMTINRQIQQDAAAMIGPQGSGGAGTGFLVIINKRIDDRGVPMPSTNTPGYVDTTNLRSDQLVFFREARDGTAQVLQPLSPSAENTFAGAKSSSFVAPYARIWYGHADRTAVDGTITGADTLVTAASGPNLLGHNWILGRQAMLLCEENVDEGKSGSTNESTWTSSLTNYIDGVAYNSRVEENSYRGEPTAAGVTTQNWMGLHDVSDWPLYFVNADDRGTNGRQSVIAPSSITDTDHYLVNDGMANNVYKTRALSSAFVGKRLRVNPVPQGEEYYAWEYAQMHPYLAENISEFVVQFAGDYSPVDGEIDRSGGEIVWYGLPYGGGSEVPPTNGGSTHNPIANTAQITNVGGDVDINVDHAYIFRHDDPDSWPYLIRIRYRIHDLRGSFTSKITVGGTEETISGQWFEVIIPVNRGS